MKRRHLAWLLLGLPRLPLAAGLPQRLLTVEWRWVERDEAPAPAADAVRGGAIIVGTQAQADSRPGASLRTPGPAAAPVQRLSVMNGEQAVLQSTQWQALPSLTLLHSTKDGDAAALQTTWLPVVDSLAVRPRWPGGMQPVTVQVSAHGSATPDADATAPASSRQLSTTVRLPLGQWVGVARSGAAAGPASPAGTVSTQDLARTRSSELQLRVTAP